MTDNPFDGFNKDLERFRQHKTRKGDRRKNQYPISSEVLKEERRRGDRRGKH